MATKEEMALTKVMTEKILEHEDELDKQDIESKDDRERKKIENEREDLK